MNTKERACCFLGHRIVTEDINDRLKEEIGNLITNENVTTFYVGHQGTFDGMVLTELKQMKDKHPQIKYTVVLAYLPASADSLLDNKNTLYPEGIESLPKRFAISWRNDWLINHSDYVICYITHITGGAAKYVAKAKNKGKYIINLS